MFGPSFDESAQMGPTSPLEAPGSQPEMLDPMLPSET